MAEVLNPYITNLPVETTTDQRVLIRDLWNDRAVPGGQTSEHSTIDPDGTRRTTTVTHEVQRTKDGRLVRDVNTEPVYACRSCHREGLHEKVMRSCDECGWKFCRKCVVVIDNDGELIEFCPDCHRSWRTEWYFSLNTA